MSSVLLLVSCQTGLLSLCFSPHKRKGHSTDTGYAVILDSDFRNLKRFPEHSNLSSFKQIFAEINLEHQQAAAVASEIKLLE